MPAIDTSLSLKGIRIMLLSIFGHDFRQGSKVNTGLHKRSAIRGNYKLCPSYDHLFHPILRKIGQSTFLASECMPSFM